MADRGRDLKVNILSDADRFDLDQPARELDDLGKAAKDAGTDMDRLVTDAKGTATKVDGAFDKIAKSSKSNLRKVDDDAHKAEVGIREMGDEATSTSKEAAASFTSVESGLDAIQEIAANAFAGFGPAGLAAGAAAAVGMGLVFSQLQKSTEQADLARERVRELADAIYDAGGDIRKVDVAGMMHKWNFEIADNKEWWEIWQESTTTNMQKFGDAARKAGVDSKDFIRGISGLDPQAAVRSLDELNRKIREEDAAARQGMQGLDDMNGSIDESTQKHIEGAAAARDAKASLLEKKGVTEQALRAEAESARITGLNTAAIERYQTALGNIAPAEDDASTAIEAAATRQAAATTTKEDSWEDYRDTVVLSVDDVIAAQQRDIKAAEEFGKNTQKVYQKAGQDAVDWALAQGPNADKAMAMLATAPTRAAKTVGANYRKAGDLASQSTAQGIRNGTGHVTGAASAVHAAAARVMSKPVVLPVSVEDAQLSAAAERAAAQRFLDRNPLVMRVRNPSLAKPRYMP